MRKIIRNVVLAALLGAGGLSYAQGRPGPKVRQVGFVNGQGQGHAVTVVRGKTHTSSVTLLIRDPNAPTSTSTVVVAIESGEVVSHTGCPEGGCNLNGWRVNQKWKGEAPRR